MDESETDDDVTKHPSWKAVLCGVCGKPMKLEDLRKKAERLGIRYPAGQPAYYIYCCQEPTYEDDNYYNLVVSLLRRYYRM
jgi:hypothetical protein